METVAKHASRDSCWVIINNTVYNLSDFVHEHPGGIGAILIFAGGDATEEFEQIHPKGTLDGLPKELIVGRVDPEALRVYNDAQAGVREESKEEPAPRTPSTTSAAAAAAVATKIPPLDQLLNLNDFEKLAEQILDKKAWAYYSSAAEDLHSKKLNSSVYRQILFRPRVFRDVAHVDLSTTFLGHRVDLPLFISPAAMARLGHPSGEAGIALAASNHGIVQMISNNASMTPEEIVSSSPTSSIFAFQLYVQQDPTKSEAMLRRVNPLVKCIVLTLDAPWPGKREADERSKTLVNLRSSASGLGTNASINGSGLGKALFAGTSASLTWAQTLPWLRQHTHHPIILKGIQTHEDALLASNSPYVSGIILSNHGGRALDSAPPAIHTLLEIRKYCPQVFAKTEVYVDGGIKRGGDIVKALCLGARGVGIGRAALFGLAVGGPDGVSRTIEILKDEMGTTMRLLGVNRVDQLRPEYLNTRAVEALIYDGPGQDEEGKGPGGYKL